MGQRNQSFAAEFLQENPELGESFKQLDLYSSLRSRLKTVEIDGEQVYVAEGDLLLDEDELMLYAARREALGAAERLGHADLLAGSGARLIGIVEGGKIVRWEPGKTLTYCILRSTFPSESQYQEVTENMRHATQAWESVCGIRFEYRRDFDDFEGTNPEGVVFPVRWINAGGQFIAAAFFPNDPQYRWRVLIDPSYFNMNFDPVGVLRHELGHVLGFRHEHIRSGAPPSCGEEDIWGTINLTDYDPQSVMHYFCGGVGSKELRISDVDRAGAQRVYGPPLSDFLFVE